MRRLDRLEARVLAAAPRPDEDDSPAKKEQIRQSMFPEQLALYTDSAQFKACHSGRRAGKSDGIPKGSVMDALGAGPNEVVILGSETLKKAKALHWQNVHSLVVRFQLPLRPNAQDAFWELPNGARLQFWGVADAGAVELLRGFKMRAAAFDEVRTYGSLLGRMVTDVIEPALGDTGGSLTLNGTPSHTRAGGWYDICAGAESHKWSVHHWDARQNPFFRAGKGGAEAWFQDILARNAWTWESATFQREYLGKFVDDSESMVVEYVPARDAILALPTNYSRDWPHVIGVDYGYNDAFAITTLTMCPWAPAARYFVHAEKAAHLTYDDAADMLRREIVRSGARVVVCDPAGGGKPFYETFNRKYGAQLGVNVRSAHKVAGSIVESIRFENTELRTGRLKVLLPAARALADEWQVLPWKDEWKQEPDDAFSQDCFDAGRYALMETIAYTPKNAPASPSDADGGQLDVEIRRQLDLKARMSEQQRTRGRWG
jgi:hypothetical protein